MSLVHRGGCICGAISYKVTGRPLLSAYCHCTLCQRFNAAAFIHTIHFPVTAFEWTHSEPHDNVLESYATADKPWKMRFRCKKCGCCVTTHNSNANKHSVYGGQFERDENGKIKGWDILKPTAHIFYETRMLDVQDELGKWTAYEGSSEQIA